VLRDSAEFFGVGGAETKAAESSMRDPKTILGGAFD